MMDATNQIKNSLILRIKNSNDLNFLNALQTIFDSAEQSLFQLSPGQQEAIEFGRTEVKRGNFVENEQLLAETREWLTKE